MSNRFSHCILEHIRERRYQPRQIRDLASEMGVSTDQYDHFCNAVETLISKGEVVLGVAKAVALPPAQKEMVGVFQRHERGFGFIVPDRATEHGDLFVPPGMTGDAMSGDRVRSQVVHREVPIRSGELGRSPYVGRIVEIVEHAERSYVGNLTKRGSSWVVAVDRQLIRNPVIVRDPHAKHAQAGDKVVIELVTYPTERELGEGVITEVLGQKGRPDVETQAVIRAFGLADRSSDAALAEARKIIGEFEENAISSDRLDLTSALVVTIDPPDARDFDDAISVRRLEDENTYELGVHIADVSHFVRSGSDLDQEAHARGNSTYLPRKVLPMLPELLSNGLCSLQPQVKRCSKSVFLYYDKTGRLQKQRFARSVIRSAKRLTYLEAQALIDGDRAEAAKQARTEPEYDDRLVAALRLMDELAKLIRERRLNEGMIELDLPEIELVFDDAGHVIDAVPEDDAFTHEIIEMFMVEANEAAARLFDTLDVPIIRRIHPDPVGPDVKAIRQFARVAGFNIPARPTRQELQALLDANRGKPTQAAVHLAVLQTLSQAEYAPFLIGHFALASEHYTHFTSPIRRYPDLLIHRALDLYFDAHPNHLRQPLPGGRSHAALSRALQDQMPDATDLTEIGRHCSRTERNSEAAERDLRKYLVLQLLANHLGEDFDGTVTRVNGSGIHVQLDRFLVEGFIHIEDLTGSLGQRWRLNRLTGALVANQSGQTISIGDRYRTRIAKIEPEARRLDLVIIEKRPAGQSRRRQSRGARTAMQQAQRLKQVKEKDRRLDRD